MNPVSASRPLPATPQPAPTDEASRLRATARELEDVFVEQMFKAMRETVPTDGIVSGGSGEEMFSAMLDQRLAAQVSGTWANGLAEAVYRQLREAAGIAPDAVAPAADSVHVAPSPVARIEAEPQ